MGPALSVSMVLAPDPAAMIVVSAPRSTPAPAPAISAWATVDALAAATALLMSLIACPCPSGPTWRTSSPISRSSGSARARFAAGSGPMMPSPSQATRTRPEANRSTGGSAVCEPEAVRDGGGLRAAADVELGEDPRDVDARRLLGHVELGADLAVGGATGDEGEDLALARGQAEGVLGLVAGGCLGLGRAVEPESRPSHESLDLVAQPAGA